MKCVSLRTVLETLLASSLIALCAPSEVAQDASATYKSKCAPCHGPDGKGSAAGQKMGTRDFASPEVKAQSDAQLAEIITKGKGKMPPYGGKLKDTEVKDLVTYIRSLAK